jgi:hypothetical protein
MPQTVLTPAFAWGTVDTPASVQFTKANVTVTTGQTDPYAGTAAVLFTRTSASDSYAYKSFTPLRFLHYPVYWLLRAGSAATTRLTIEQGGSPMLDIVVTWSGGVPTVTSVATGTALAILSLGSGWYMVRGITTPLTGLTAALYVIRPDNTGTSGTVYYYGVNLVVLEMLDEPVYYREVREGTEWMQGRSGVEDAWLVGVDYYLRGTARYLPSQDADNPGITTGWWGSAETPGVGVGVQSLIEAGWRRQSITYSYNRAGLGAAFPGCYLVEPASGEPGLEPNAQETIELVLRNPNGDVSLL